MPSHWHFVLQRTEDGGMAIFLRWVTLTHPMPVSYHTDTAGEGHGLPKADSKSFPSRRMMAISTSSVPLRRKRMHREPSWSSVRRIGRWGSVPLGSASETFATAIVAVPLARSDNWIRRVNEALDDKQPRYASLVESGVAFRSVSEWGGVDRPSTGPRIDATSTRTPEKEAHFNLTTKQRVLTAFSSPSRHLATRRFCFVMGLCKSLRLNNKRPIFLRAMVYDETVDEPISRMNMIAKGYLSAP